MSISSEIAVLSLRQQLGSRDYFNVLAYQQGVTDPSAYDAAALAKLLQTVWDNVAVGIGAFQTDSLIYVDGTAVTLGPAIGLPVGGPPYTHYRNPPHLLASYTPMSTIAGGVSGDWQPAFVAFKIGKVTGLAGKSNRGSIHIAGVPESGTVKNWVKEADRAAFQTAINDVLLAPVSFTLSTIPYTFAPVVYSPTRCDRNATIGLSSYASANVVTSMPLSFKLGTMKHRKTRLPVDPT